MSLTITSSAPTTAIQPTLESRLQGSLEHARRLTALYGASHIDVAIAWEAVEEISITHRRQAVQPSAFARYCAAHPNAPECRLYDN